MSKQKWEAIVDGNLKMESAKEASENHKYNLPGSCDPNECTDYHDSPNNYDGNPLDTLGNRGPRLPSQRFGL